jgi:hypothetical protein
MKNWLLFISMSLLTACQSSYLPEEIIKIQDKLPETIDYNLHIKPILSDRCFKCHGPDKNKVEAGLQLTTFDLATQKLKSGKKAIVPSDIDKSELIKRILSNDPDEQMPTPASHLSLNNEEKALLIKWIEQGAAYKEHWAFTKIEEPDVPKIGTFFSRLGITNHWETDWSKNEIDNFIVEKLNKNQLKPSKEASKTTLLRRLYMDLTGLPPTVKEVDAFLNDKSENAYEKLVDRLLASPHYGERMAVEWLDVARYADTHGYQLDVPRTAYPYRDWVINAYNKNLPFDQFIKWQLAGDLLPKPTTEQLIATAFNRMHTQNQEGGIVEEEYRVEYAADRVNTFGKAFLGLTVECARCHDHKYDPISQKDYYSLFAFFNNINEAGQVPFNGESSPTITLTTPEAEKQLKFINEQLKSPNPQPFSYEIKTKNPCPDKKWIGGAASYSFEDSDPKVFKNDANIKLNASLSGNIEDVPKVIEGKFGKGRYVNGEGNIDLGKEIGFFDHHQAFSIALWVNIQRKGIRGPIFSRSNGLDNGNRGYECIMNSDGTFNFNMNHAHPDNSIDLHIKNPLPIKKWVHIAITYDGQSRANGTKVYIDGQLASVEIWADNLKKSMLYGIRNTNSFGLFFNFLIGSKFRDSMADFMVDELRIYEREINQNDVKRLLNNEVLSFETSPEKGSIKEELRKKRIEIYQQLEEVMIMKERLNLNKTYLLKRGVYDAKGEEVGRMIPTKLYNFKKFQKNRLGLSNWLFSPDNQLFTRVIVNRFWQQFFGNGLVKTSDDFGNQGEMPSHPELLDWLAIQFRNDNWDVKKFIKRIVLSATYRQSSVADKNLLELDPDNRFLARSSNYRYSAEQVRDNALAASGLLVRKIGGQSVFPYQPDGVWEAVSTLKYVQNHQDSLYRRSMYTFWKRTVPPPMMLNFDASEKVSCTVKRQKTSTPLQALVTMNDPQFVEAARVLASKIGLGLKDGNIDKTITYAFKAVLSRPPRSQELNLLKKLYEEQLADYNQNPKEAEQILQIGEYPVDKSLNVSQLASMTIVCNTIMNMDEAVVRR